MQLSQGLEGDVRLDIPGFRGRTQKHHILNPSPSSRRMTETQKVNSVRCGRTIKLKLFCEFVSGVNALGSLSAFCTVHNAFINPKSAQAFGIPKLLHPLSNPRTCKP